MQTAAMQIFRGAFRRLVVMNTCVPPLSSGVTLPWGYDFECKSYKAAKFLDIGNIDHVVQKPPFLEVISFLSAANRTP